MVCKSAPDFDHCCRPHQRTGWYTWHLDLFDSPEELFEEKGKTLTIRIPEENKLNDKGWQSIRTDLFQHFKELQRALSTDAIAPHVFRTVYQVSRLTGNLMRLATTAPPEPPITQDEGMSMLIEQMQLRDLIDEVRSFLDRLPKESEAHKQIEFWLTAFVELAETATPLLRKLPPKGHDIPADLELAFAPKLLAKTRPKIVLAGVDLIRLLTTPNPAT